VCTAATDGYTSHCHLSAVASRSTSDSFATHAEWQNQCLPLVRLSCVELDAAARSSGTCLMKEGQYICRLLLLTVTERQSSPACSGRDENVATPACWPTATSHTRSLSSESSMCTLDAWIKQSYATQQQCWFLSPVKIGHNNCITSYLGLLI